MINSRGKPHLRIRGKYVELIPLSLKQQTSVNRLALAVGESTDLNATYRTIFKHVAEVLELSSFLVSVYNAEEGVIHFKYAIFDGVETSVSRYKPIRVEKEKHKAHSQVILTGKPLVIKGKLMDADNFQSADYILNDGMMEINDQPESKTKENTHSTIFIPLRVNRKTIGVIQVQTPSKGAHIQQDIDLLSALANVAAIAIQNATLFETLQYMNADLSLSYDSTLEGWARALELRDFETTGHSVRVTDMALILAVHMGIRGQALVNIRRGALLHDVGKMGIPDNILLKPAPLTPGEWDIMRKHPLYGFRMLEPIEFLRPALETVLYHHEKWDGSGYPAGLVRELIPLAARVFAIVDVWDSLIHARPYKRAWTEQEAREYIRDQSNKHFDPAVVEKFFLIVN